MILASRVAQLPPSQTIAMAQRAREMKASGLDVINLSLGEPDFDTPKVIQEAAKQAIDDGYFHYPPLTGYPELREVISKKLKRENHLDYTPEEIIVSTGAKQSIANVIFSLINPGDEILIPAPYWVSYPLMAQLAGGDCRYLSAEADNDFKFTAEMLEANLSHKTRLLIYSSPCNPTGAVYNQQELSDIADVIEKYPNLMVISDEIYEHINFTGKHQSIAQFEKIREQVIVVNGVSKAYAMTGWRLGYLAGPKALVKACSQVQAQFTSGASSISQIAAKYALTCEKEIIEPMIKAYHQRRNSLIQYLNTIESVNTPLPSGAFYAFPDISAFFGMQTFNKKTIQCASDLCEYLLETAKVATVAGEAFGDPRCIRLSFATSEPLLTDAAARIKEALSQLS